MKGKKVRLFRRTGSVRCSEVRRDLSAFIDGRLDPEKQTALERHISGCPQCEKEIVTLQATVSLLHRLPEETPLRPISVCLPVTRPASRRGAVAWFGMATALVCLLLVTACAVDLTNVFQTTPQLQEDSYDDIGQRSTSGLSAAEPDGQVLSTESRWVRPAEFGLLGATVVMGTVTYILWRKGRRLVVAPARR